MQRSATPKHTVGLCTSVLPFNEAAAANNEWQALPPSGDEPSIQYSKQLARATELNEGRSADNNNNGNLFSAATFNGATF